MTIRNYSVDFEQLNVIVSFERFGVDILIDAH